jgi:hypothetical protein
VFTALSVPRSYFEDNWGRKVSCQLVVSSVQEAMKKRVSCNSGPLRGSSVRETVKIEPERVKMKDLHC